MNLTEDFSTILKRYHGYLSGSYKQGMIEDLSINTNALPIAASKIWLKIQVGEEIDVSDYQIIARIQSDWKTKTRNVFDEEADIYTSNLAIYYMTLLELKNNYKMTDLQKEMTQIRDYIFDNMIRKGLLISSIRKGRPDFDLVLSVLPFGMFAPEDLIMVSAIESLLSGTSEIAKNQAALLGIYFTEKYDFVKAEKYLLKAQENGKESSLEKLLTTYLHQKKKNISENIFIHQPLGNGNVYDKLPYERAPHYPKVGEKCSFKVQVNMDNIDEVYLVLDGFKDSIPCQLSDEKLSIYEAEITIPDNYERGIYRFIASGESESKSEEYNLSIQEDIQLNNIQFYGSNEDGNIYEGSYAGSHSLFMILTKNKIQFTEEQPTLSSDKLNTDFAWINKSNDIVVNDNNLFTFSENMIEIHLLLGIGITGITLNIEDQSLIYYGFGERYNSINQYGNVVDCFVYNQYRDQGTRTYLPMPYFFTNEKYGLYVATDYYTEFDLQSSQKDLVQIYIATEPTSFDFEIYLLNGEMKEMVTQYIDATGEPVMLPSWALGPWMSSNNWDRDSIVRNQVELTNNNSIPATVIVLEQWSDETTYYMFNDAQYPMLEAGEYHTYEQMDFPSWGRWPDPKGLIDYCHENNLKFILWQVPIQKYLNQQKHPLKDQDEAYMIDQGYAVKNADGTPYRIPENWFTNSLLLDYTNPAAKEWWFNKRQYLIDIGVDGFKTDGGEMVYGADVTFYDGSNGRKMRNKYPKDYIKAYHEFAQQNDGITFSRSGYVGAQSFPAHWAGDERSTFDAFKRQLIAGINSGMSGIIFWGWDLGGFNGDIPTAELYMRSAAMATFCPIMQYHAESKGEFNQDRTPWNIAERTNTPEVISVYRFFANTRMNLLPYIYEQSMKSVNERVPLMRALQIEYPKEDFSDCYDQFMFGDSLLIAPVIEEGAQSRKIELPIGTWTNFWTREVYSGGQTIELSVDFTEIPVFIKENSAILINVGKSGKIGESIGNNIKKYTNAKVIVTANENFEQEIHDHLGNVINVRVVGDKVSIENGPDGIEVEFIKL